MTAQLSQHLEDMDHEISGLELKIAHQGFRVDGHNGIKSVVGLGNRRSVDYFYVQSNRCRFIEFSDLARGQEDLLGLDESLSKVDSHFHQNQLRKLVKNHARDEMVEKFKDSKDIFQKLPDFYDELPEALSDENAKTFFIVYAPINAELSNAEKAVIARFLETLQTRISNKLEDDICDRVKLVLLDRFVAGLG